VNVFKYAECKVGRGRVQSIHRHTVFEIFCGIFASDQYIAMLHTSIGIGHW